MSKQRINTRYFYKQLRVLVRSQVAYFLAKM